MKTNVTPCYNGGFVIDFILSMLAVIRVFFRSRGDTALEILALRQQVAVLKRKRPRPRLNAIDRLLWTAKSETLDDARLRHTSESIVRAVARRLLAIDLIARTEITEDGPRTLQRG